MTGLCDSCQKNAAIMREVRGKPIPICDLCHENQEVGRVLPKTQFVAFMRGARAIWYSLGSYELVESLERFNGNPLLILSLDGYKDVPPAFPWFRLFGPLHSAQLFGRGKKHLRSWPRMPMVESALPI